MAKREFLRIPRPGGWVAVAWNDRLGDATDLTREYAALTRACAETQPVVCPAPSLSTGLDRLFGDFATKHATFPHAQHFNLPGLLGRARSSGYLAQLYVGQMTA